MRTNIDIDDELMAEAAAVRISVISRPSMIARGSPVTASKTAITAWCVCSAVLCG